MIRNKIIDKVALVVVSCDNYSDLGKVSFSFIKNIGKKSFEVIFCYK